MPRPTTTLSVRSPSFEVSRRAVCEVTPSGEEQGVGVLAHHADLSDERGSGRSHSATPAGGSAEAELLLADTNPSDPIRHELMEAAQGIETARRALARLCSWV